MNKKIVLSFFTVMFLIGLSGCGKLAGGYFYSQALEKMKEKDYESAIRDLDLAIEYHPKLYEAYIDRGWAKYLLDDTEGALEDCNNVDGISPGNAGTYHLRGIVYNKMRLFENAIDNFNSAEKLSAGNADIYFFRGAAYLETRQYDKAIADIDKVLSTDPNNTVALVMRAQCYYSKGAAELAKKNFEAALNIDKNFYVTYMRMGNIYRQEGKLDEAMKAYTKAIELNPRFSGNYLFRGVAYFIRREYKKAEADFQSAVKCDPKEKYLVIWKYLAQKYTGKEADQELKAYAKNLKNHDWHDFLIRFFAGETGPAQLLNAASHKVPRIEKEQLCEAHFFLGIHYKDKGNKQKALAHFQKSIDTGIINFVEYDLSKKMILRLKGK